MMDWSCGGGQPETKFQRSLGPKSTEKLANRLFQQFLESHLLKMLVVSKCLYQIESLHHNKRSTISKRELFIRILFTKTVKSFIPVSKKELNI